MPLGVVTLPEPGLQLEMDGVVPAVIHDGMRGEGAYWVGAGWKAPRRIASISRKCTTGRCRDWVRRDCGSAHWPYGMAGLPRWMGMVSRSMNGLGVVWRLWEALGYPWKGRYWIRP